MAQMANYLEGQLINDIFRTTARTRVSVIAIALLTTGAVDADTGAFSGTGVEVGNANSYARVTLNPADANWAAVSSGNGTTSNQSTITFPTATGSWGTIVGVGLVDDATYGSGNLLFYGTLAVNKVVNNGDVFTFQPNQLTVQIDN